MIGVLRVPCLRGVRLCKRDIQSTYACLRTQAVLELDKKQVDSFSTKWRDLIKDIRVTSG